MNFDINRLEGWCDKEKALTLFNLVMTSNSQLTVELGVFGGKSLIPMALAHKTKGSGGVIGIDAWRKDVGISEQNSKEHNKWWLNMDFASVYKKMMDVIFQEKLFDYIDLLKITSESCACLFRDEIVDIIHQDSAHNEETIIAELQKWIPKLKIGGYWVADDTDWNEARQGYSKLPEYGLELVDNYTKWQIWKKVKPAL